MLPCGIVPYLLVLALASIGLAWPKETRDSCINDMAHLQGRLDGDCSNPSFPKWHGPNGRIPSSTKYVISSDGYGLTIHGVQRSDEGNYTLKQFCTEGAKHYTITLKVNCQYLLEYAGSTVILTWPKPNFLEKAPRLKTKIHASFPHIPKVLLVLNGKTTNASQKIFGERLVIGPDGHTLTLKNIKENEAGNYTILWQWTEGFNLKSKSYTYSIIVAVATGSSTTSTPKPTSPTTTNYRNISKPTGHRNAHGAATMLASYGYLLLIAAVSSSVFIS